MSRKHVRTPLCGSLPCRGVTLVVTLAVLALSGVSCSGAEREPDALASGASPRGALRGDGAAAPNVLLIVVDTLRADRVGRRLPHGGPAGARLTPFLDGLAARGASFASAYTPTPWTSPAIATLFTSRYPLQHRVSRYDSKLAPAELTLAERLRAAGYACAGFSANLYIQARLGYAQGFEDWHTYLKGSDGEIKPRASVLTERALAWVASREVAGDARPGFLYLQFLEPHSPYVPPEPHRERVGVLASGDEVRRANAALQSFRFSEIDDRDLDLLRSLYDGEVAFFDAAVRDLFAALEPTGFLDDAIVIVTSDHGEEFREHESLLHGLSLFEAAVRVPLLIVAPGVAAGQVVARPVSMLDIPATVLDLLGIPPVPQFEGRSLAQLIQTPDGARGAANPLAAPDAILLELSHRGGKSEVRRHSWGLIRGSLKLLIDAAGDAWVYELDSDPSEQEPRAATAHTAGPEMLSTLARLRQDLSTRIGPVSTAVLDDVMRQQLQALGYGVGEEREGR